MKNKVSHSDFIILPTIYQTLTFQGTYNANYGVLIHILQKYTIRKIQIKFDWKRLFRQNVYIYAYTLR
jgi:hypothetical protein